MSTRFSRPQTLERHFVYPDPDADAYKANPPFPHVVLKGAWDPESLDACKREIDAFNYWDGEKDFYGAKKKRIRPVNYILRLGWLAWYPL